MSYDIWKEKREKAEIDKTGLKILKDITISGKPTLTVWMPKAIKPHINYYYNTEEAREKKIQEAITNYINWQLIKEERKKERVGTPEMLELIKVGDIFHYSWGYEQTNCEFYQVVNKNHKTVTIREIGQKTADDSIFSHGMADYRLAVKDDFVGEPIKKLITFISGKPIINFKFGIGTIWDGKPEYNSWYA